MFSRLNMGWQSQFYPVTLHFMHIAIIGAGFTGLAAAWELRKAGHQISIYEANAFPGGLAAGFRNPEWEWSLEHHYHHIFRSDHVIQHLVKEMDLQDLLFFQSVKSSMHYDGHQFRFDSPTSLLTCPALSLNAKLRTAVTLAFLKFWPRWKIFESITAEAFIKKTMGEEAWNVLWKPLFDGKFGKYASEVNASWFWSRIHVRTAELGYFRGGFLNLADNMVEKLKARDVQFYFNHPVSAIEQYPGKETLAVTINDTIKEFDKVLVTSPAPVFSKIVKGLDDEYKHNITNLKGLAAVTMVLELDTRFFRDKTYWLNINEENWPILAVVEHTRFTGKHPYNDHSIVYIGKYLESSDPQYQMDKDKLLELYMPYLHKLSPHVDQHILNSWVFHAPFAQPIVTLNHAQKVPSIETPIKNVYWSSLQHVYPWDRGTNYAVLLGQRAATIMTQV